MAMSDTDWRTILLAADKGTEIAADRRRDATTRDDTDHWRRLETRLDNLATFAMLALEFGHS